MFLSALPLSLLAIAALIVFFVVLPLRRVRSYKQEGTTTYFFPVLGVFFKFEQNLKLKGDMMKDIKDSSKTTTNPKYFVSNIGRIPYIMLQDPKYIKEFLQKQTPYVKAHFIDVLKPLIGNGLVSAEGDTWKRHRKIISGSFNFEFLKNNVSVVQNTTKEFLDKYTAEDYKSFSAISRIQDITGEIVGRIFFGENLNNYTMDGKLLTLALAELMAELTMTGMDPLVLFFGTGLIKLPIIPRYRRIMRKVQTFRGICFQIIKDRKARPQSDTRDLLSSLLATQQLEEVENRFSDEDIMDEFITFFVAGMDTTGHLVGMALYNLVQHPQYLEELKRERDLTYNLKKELTADTLSKMDSLHAFLKETLRFHTPAPMVFPRRALHDHNILDLKINKGELVASAFLTPAFNDGYFEDPDKFNPSRWSQGTDSKVDSFAFTPFSAGPRNCIGQHLAIMEAKVIMSEFLERFDFGLKDDGYELKMIWRFLYEPFDELFLKLSPKQKQTKA